MINGQTPVLILREGTERSKGRSAQENNIAAAKAIADAVRSTLGPRGMDKMLVDAIGDVTITNDGVTILKEIDVAHPAAKMIVEVAKTQDEEAGDGTTTSVILTGELLRQAEELIESNVHPTVISSGYSMAAERALETIKRASKKLTIDDIDILKEIAITSMRSKVASLGGAALAESVVEAVIQVAKETDDGYEVDLENIQIIKKTGGATSDTETLEGIILDKEPVHLNMPDKVEGAKIAIVSEALEMKKMEIETKVQITDPSQIQDFFDMQDSMFSEMVGSLTNAGANVLVCQRGIDEQVQHYLAKHNIYAVRRVTRADMRKLAKATGGKIVSKLQDLTESDLGTANLVSRKKIAGDQLTFVTGCKNPKAVSLLVRGGTEHILDEIERSLHDALCVVADALEDGAYITGGGSTAMEITTELRNYAPTVGGREQLAIEAFATAMETIPKTLAENAGIDPIDTLLMLRKEHSAGNIHAGLNVYSGEVENMIYLKVLEPARVGRQAVASATDATIMILRIDDVIAAKSQPQENPKG